MPLMKSVKVALKDYLGSEIIDVVCSKCDEKHPWKVAKSFYVAPLTLVVVQLKRFVYCAFLRFYSYICTVHLCSFPRFNNDLQKVNREVKINKILTIEKKVYDLIAVINHIGATPKVGHYTAAAPNADGSWTLYDDENIRSDCDMKSLQLQKRCYILFYNLRGVVEPKKFVAKPKVIQPCFLLCYAYNVLYMDSCEFVIRNIISVKTQSTSKSGEDRM